MGHNDKVNNKQKMGNLRPAFAPTFTRFLRRAAVSGRLDEDCTATDDVSMTCTRCNTGDFYRHVDGYGRLPPRALNIQNTEVAGKTSSFGFR